MLFFIATIGTLMLFKTYKKEQHSNTTETFTIAVQSTKEDDPLLSKVGVPLVVN
jgi:hypothetical protein